MGVDLVLRQTFWSRLWRVEAVAAVDTDYFPGRSDEVGGSETC